MKQGMEILFEDESLLVVYKPAGIATQTNRLGQQDMVSLLRNYRATKKEAAYIGVIHRLDQPVEGVMVFAKNQETAAALSKQVQQRTLGKHYYALVHGILEKEKNTLKDELIFDKKNNCSYILGAKEERLNITSQELAAKKLKVQKASLTYQVLSVTHEPEDQSLVDIHLETGRHHQIRLQFANQGHPLVDDRKYGTEPGKGMVKLCSYCIEFTHPTTGEEMHFEIKPRGFSAV